MLKGERTHSRKLRFGNLAGLIIVGMSVLAWFGSRPTLESEARKQLECMANKDADCLYKMIPDEEKKALKLTSENLEKLLSEFVAKSLVITEVKNYQYVENFETGSGTVSCIWVLDGGREITPSATVYKGDNGIVHLPMVSDLILITGLAKYGRDAREWKGRVKIECWAKLAKYDGATLTRMGFRGIYDGPEIGTRTWDQYEKAIHIRLNATKLATNQF